MSTLEKLIRAFEALKTVQLPPAAPSDDAVLRRKDKTSHCITIADAMCNATMKSTQEFSQLLSISIETLLQLCDDPDSDVRMVADESLNKIIRALMDNNIGKIQLELHKEIKKNGSARTLRAALWRFAELCHMIRPQKGKPYMQSLVPFIEQIAKRTEEPVLETLSAAVDKIFQSLGIFSTDSEVKVLLKAFLQNVSSTSAVARRTAASAIVCICLHSKKPQAFITWSLNTVLESLLPVRDEAISTPAILGALGVVRSLIPHLNLSLTSSEQAEGEMMRGSFGKTKSRNSKLDMSTASLDRFIQIYELSLHFALHKDHNVTNASLECLQQLLRSPPQELLPVLLSPSGINRSHILSTEEQHIGLLQRRTLSQISVSHSIASDDASILLDESMPDPVRMKPKLQVVGESQSSLHCESPLGSDFSTIQTQSLTDIPHGVEDVVDSPLHIVTHTPSVERDSPQVDDKDEEELSLHQKQEEEDKNEIETDTCISSDQNVAQCDIGSFCDVDVPLIYCTRRLANNFLLTGKSEGLKSDKEVRVSVKALAMGCIAGVVGLWPEAFVLNMDKSGKEKQCIRDILLFASHPDPQLRGLTSLVVGSLINSALVTSGNSISNWTNKHDMTVSDLLKPLYQGLQGDSSVSCRQTISTLQSCICPLLKSQDSLVAIPLLSAAISMHSNPYWLVKVRLLELLAELPFVSIAHVTRRSLLQHQVIHNVFVPLLADDDARVRHAATLAITKCIPNLFFSSDEPTHDPVTAQAVKLSNEFFMSALLVHTTDNSSSCFPHRIFSLPQPFDGMQDYQEINPAIEGALSRIVHLLGSLLLTATTRYLMFGCCEALTELSNKFPATEFPRAWNCINFPRSSKEPTLKRTPSENEMKAGEEVSPAGGLFSTALALLTSSPGTLDLSCQQWLLQLCGNLFAGMAVSSLQGQESDVLLEESSSNSKQPWSFLKDKKLTQSADLLLGHTVRVLAMFSHVFDETVPTVVNPKPALSQSLPSISSPIKRKSKISPNLGEGGLLLDKSQGDDKTSDDKKGNRGPVLGYFVNIPHCMRIYELLKSAHMNFKLTLEAQASEKFLALLHTTLNVLSQILEVASLNEVGRGAEELLNYLKVTTSVEPVATVACVQQLLKSLFGTNVGAQKQEVTEDKPQSMQRSDISENCSGFYEECYQKPYRELSSVLESNKRAVQEHIEGDIDSLWSGRQRDRKSPLFKSKDRAALASYIKLFEPMVIKALEQYTITSDVQLQCRVLQLLSQLVQLRVNYCLLDSDKIFIGFVLKQFELIEKGQILFTEELIPRIFQFLVHLSYEKNHSKAIIGVPEVIQLCDGLMASGQSPVTHCIPALVPVVEDVFLMRGGSTASSNVSELDTQREVLVAVLLRLVEYHQVLELLAMVLSQSRLDNKERWLRWSRKVVDTLFPLLAQSQVRLESRSAQISLLSLLTSLAPSVMQPVDPLLHVLFSEPPVSVNKCVVITERWLGSLLGILPQLIVHSTEEMVLARLVELNLDATKTLTPSCDPLNVSRPQCAFTPETVLTRLIFQTIEVIASHVCSSVVRPIVSSSESEYLKEQLSHFLFYCIYMLESGSYCKVATTAIQLVGSNTDEEPQLPIEDINNIFLELASFCPLLTFQWCYMLILLGYNDHKFWSQILNTGNSSTPLTRPRKPFNTAGGVSPCCNLEIVRRGGVILFSDFVCDNLGDAEQVTWLLVNHIEEVVRLSKEVPVQELIAAVHRNPAASGLLVQAVAVRCQDLSQPSLVSRLLQQCLEGVHPTQSGALLQLLVSRLLNLPQLALARQASALACKRAEMLLTASSDEVESQLSKTELQALLHQIGNKHERLKGLLKKLSMQVYELSFEDASRAFDPVNIKTVSIDRSWFLSQLKQRCCHAGASGSNVSQMLSELKLDEILSVMGSPKFNLSVLDECLKYGCYLSLQSKEIEKDIKVSPLFEAAQTTVLHRIKHILELLPRPHQVFQPVGRHATSKEQKFSQRLSTLFCEPAIWNSIVQLSKAVSSYVESLLKLSLNSLIPIEHQIEFAKFAVLCLEAAHWQVFGLGHLICPGALEPTLRSAASVLSQPHVAQEFTPSGRHAWLASACSAIYAITNHLLEEETLTSPCQAPGLSKALEDPEHLNIVHACPQISTLVSWIEKTQQIPTTIPEFLYNSIRMVIVALGRMSAINSYVATPPEIWRQGWAVPLGGSSLTTVPPLPVDMLLETEVLEQFIFRLTLLGWTSRQQFEENWMALLGVLNSIQDEENISPDEVTAIVQANGLAVRGITALLIQSLLLPIPGNPITSKLIHQPRELTRLPNNEVQNQLKAIHGMLFWKLEDLQLTKYSSWQFQDVFQRPNLERSGLNASYGYSQVSLQYLATVTRISEEPYSNLTKPDLYTKREECLTVSGLDIHSCLHFLLDLYTQWTSSQAHTPLRLLLEAVRSVLMVSDIFTEKAQFHWMLHTFLELGKNHPPEDEILHQFLSLGVSKAAAVLGQEDSDMLERVRKMTENSLRSGFLPSRLCGLHGLLYLLQGPRYMPHTATDDTLQLAIEYIQRHMDLASGNHSERHLLALWALVFFLLEEEQVTDSDMAPAVLQLALALVSAGNQPSCLNTALVQGLEKLVLCGTVSGHVGEQVTKLSLERLRQTNPAACLSALQLLLTCMYTVQKRNETPDEADPEILLHSLEKTSALFDRIRKGYPHEVELFCGVLPTLLSDFFPPSEMLTKVIGEFLSSQQPHPKLLAGVVFQLFERACGQDQLPLLQDWVVISLSNFTQCSPVGMAVWCLTCFFVSASTNQWLRAMFPHIQSRIGRCEVEDRKILCLAARDFYHKLSESQKQDFMTTFQAAAEPQTPFFDIISSL